MSDQPVVSNIWSDVDEKYTYRVYLTDVFEQESSHNEAIDLLRAVSEKDEVHLYITSPGGLVSVADMYIAAIQDCKGTVYTHGVGDVCSAAVIVFLSGDVRIPEHGSSYMIHNVQYGVEGDSANIKVRVDFWHRLFKEKFYELYSEVLTEEELEELFDRAGEIYLTAKEMSDRLDSSEGITQSILEVVINEDGEYGTVIRQGDHVIGAGYTLGTEHKWTVIAQFPEQEKEEKVQEKVIPKLNPVVFKDPLPLSYSSDLYDDSFSVELADGYRKVFKLSNLSWEDFVEYNREELVEIAEALGATWFNAEDSFDDLVADLINLMTVGANGSA